MLVTVNGGVLLSERAGATWRHANEVGLSLTVGTSSERMRSLRMTLAVLSCASMLGCTSTHSNAYYADHWLDANASLGKIAVLPPRYKSRFGHDSEREKLTYGEIYDNIKRVVGKLNGVDVVDGSAVLAAIGDVSSSTTPISDYDAVTAARKVAGIDTVCMVTMGAYNGNVVVGLPPIFAPLWSAHTYVGYSLRLVDVHSGKLLLDAVRFRETGGGFSIRTSSDIPNDFAEDLEDLLCED